MRRRGFTMQHYYFQVGTRTYRILASSQERAAAKLAQLRVSGRTGRPGTRESR
jgi:hypothetical protein